MTIDTDGTSRTTHPLTHLYILSFVPPVKRIGILR